MNANVVDPWERIRKETVINEAGLMEIIKVESSKAYETFCHYRDMPYRTENPKSRSIDRVVEETGKSRSTLSQWSSQWKWVERSALYDVHMERTLRKEMEKTLHIAIRRNLRVLQELQEKGVAALLLKEPGDFTVPQAIHAIETGIKLERLIMDEAIENIEHHGTAPQFIAIQPVERVLTPEEAEQIRLLEKHLE